MGVKGKAEKEDKSEHSVLCDHATNNKEKCYLLFTWRNVDKVEAQRASCMH